MENCNSKVYNLANIFLLRNWSTHLHSVNIHCKMNIVATEMLLDTILPINFGILCHLSHAKSHLFWGIRHFKCVLLLPQHPLMWSC